MQRKTTITDVPVLPDVGSITTLFPGINLPSRSASSTIRFAILSLTEPPDETNSTFATKEFRQDVENGDIIATCHRKERRTQITTKTLLFYDLV